MTVENAYWSLVRAALWGGSAEWDAQQTERLLRLHVMQGTGALVFPNVLEQENIPAQERMLMKSVCMQTMQQHVHLQHILETAWTALTGAGLKPVLMKGAGLAAYYPEPQQRAWGDIDLFLGKEQYHQACAVMRDTFPDALKFDEELDHYKHYNLIADGVSIEIHRVSVGFQHPVDALRYARIEHYGMTNAIPLTGNPSPVTLTVPEPTFNALFVMLHSWEHAVTKGASVRQLCDLALLLHRHPDLNRKQLRRWLSQLHLTDVWQLYMWILVERLGLPQAEAPFYSERVAQRAERLLNDMLAGRLVSNRTAEQAPANRIARKWHTMRERWLNAKRIGQYSPAYARHMKAETLLHGALRFFAKDRHWE